MLLRFFLVVGCLLFHGCSSKVERAHHLTPVKMIVGRATSFLPVLLAQRLRLYEKQGLAVSIEDVQGTVKTTQALLGGSVEVAGGMYEQTLGTAAHGQIVTSFVTLMNGDSRALVVSPGKSKTIHRIENLRGSVIGVSTVGSPNEFFATSILQRHGIARRDVSIVAVGVFTTAVAAIERGRVDAAVLTGSSINLYQKRNPEAVLLVDARSPAGTKEAFGTDQYATAVLYSTPKWLGSNRDTARRLGTAVRECLQWIQENSPEEIVKNMPEPLRTEPDADREAIKVMKANFSPDGLMSVELASAVKQAYTALPENRAARNVDITRTFTNEFVAKP